MQDRCNQIIAAQKMRRDRGVRLQSKGALIARGRQGGNQFPESRR